MTNGIKDGYYKEITPAGFGIAIKAGKVLVSKQTKFQKLDIFETESSLGRVLTLDDLMMTTEGDEYHYHEMIAHVPMMHHKCPKTLLVIGGGDGGTVREVLKHDTVEKVVLCEIDGDVSESCTVIFDEYGYHAQENDSSENSSLFDELFKGGDK